ncbi:MAG TPA: hypothetical protein V6D17_00655 [Candidatus Obscuribacterales bacterium]
MVSLTLIALKVNKMISFLPNDLAAYRTSYTISRCACAERLETRPCRRSSPGAVSILDEPRDFAFEIMLTTIFLCIYLIGLS